jgi:hypothetical protein
MSKPWVTALVVTLAGVSVLVAEDQPTDRASDLARQRWGKSLRKLERLSTEAMKAVFKDKPVFRAVVFNPKSVIAGRPTFNHAFILEGDKLEAIEGDEQAAMAISRQAVKTETADQAGLLAQAFADLRGYEVRTQGHGDEDQGKDYSKSTTAAADGWVVSLALEVDPNIQYCARYKISVKKDGTLSIGSQGRVCIHNLYQ